MDTFLTILPWAVAAILSIIVFIAVVPASKDGKLGEFGQFLHDLFNFKSLLIEKTLKFLYVFSTMYTICIGIINIFRNGTSEGYVGFLILIVGPIAVRLVYELAMMLVLGVTNIIDINNKFGYADEEYDNSDKDPDFAGKLSNIADQFEKEHSNNNHNYNNINY